MVSPSADRANPDAPLYIDAETFPARLFILDIVHVMVLVPPFLGSILYTAGEKTTLKSFAVNDSCHSSSVP